MNQQNTTADADRAARLDALLDRQEILDCLCRISRAIDRFDRDLFLSGFHGDAVIDAGSLVGGPGEVYDRGAELHEHGQSSTLHNLLNHTCDITGATAHTETYFLYTGHNRDGSNWLGGGRYLDRLERRSVARGEVSPWRVAFRYTVMEWSGTIPGNQVPLFENIDDLRANGVPSRTPEDPSYRRPLVNHRRLRTPPDMRSLSTPGSS